MLERKGLVDLQWDERCGQAGPQSSMPPVSGRVQVGYSSPRGVLATSVTFAPSAGEGGTDNTSYLAHRGFAAVDKYSLQGGYESGSHMPPRVALI